MPRGVFCFDHACGMMGMYTPVGVHLQKKYFKYHEVHYFCAEDVAAIFI